MPWNSVCSFCCCCCCCLEPALGKDIWIRVTSTTVMTIFSKLSLWKLLYHNYVQSFFSTVTRHIDQRILKDTLQLKILRTWIKIRTNSFIKTWVNIMKRKSTKMRRNLSLAKKYEGCTKDHISLVVIRFFFSQTNLVFKFSPVTEFEPTIT